MARDTTGGGSGRALRQGRSALTLLAAVFLAAGLVALIYPLAATVATLAWVGALFALCGLFQLLHVWTARGWRALAWHLGSGAVCLLGGLAILFDPLLGAVAVNLLIAAVLMASGSLRLATALAMRPAPGWLGLALAGVLAIAVGAGIVLLPLGESVLVPGLLVGAALLVDGGVLMSLSLAARRAS